MNDIDLVSDAALPQVHRSTSASLAVQKLAEVYGPYMSRWMFGGRQFDATCVKPAIARQALEQAASVVPQMARPATAQEIRQHLAALLGCYPAGKTDPKVFARMLTMDVSDEQPSIGALTMACRQLRRESEFMPMISEVLAALRAASVRVGIAARALDEMPKMIEAHEEQIEYQRRRWEAERRQNQVAL
ncbi:MAG: hypothetical protein JNK84_17935 [Phreatobacter sp.]|uniref:hypothetical protein n=1 Tax=Phreatobacter sp. TaxID=1966341 RepID=UPI001A5E6DEB|nr:hypothetical protein [Phreatobacter sp.]MBL8570954.1 hypothetical protein [Phreatobacter sp.]